jgi:hypothetical protein
MARNVNSGIDFSLILRYNLFVLLKVKNESKKNLIPPVHSCSNLYSFFRLCLLHAVLVSDQKDGAQESKNERAGRQRGRHY